MRRAPATINRPRFGLRLALPIAALLTILVASASPVFAATFGVNSAADAADANPGDGVCATAAGDCSLRAAVQETNASGGATIFVPLGTYSSDVRIEAGVAAFVAGSGADTTILNGAVDVAHGASLTIQQSRIGGVTCLNAPGAAPSGTLVLDHAESGGIAAENCSVTINDSVVHGGVSSISRSLPLTIQRSTVKGGIRAEAPTTISDSSILDSVDDETIHIVESTVRIDRSEIRGNGASSWLVLCAGTNEFDSALSITDTTIADNSGTGIDIDRHCQFSMTRSLYARNSAGILSLTEWGVSITDSSFIDNEGTALNIGPVSGRLEGLTIVGNSGGGISSFYGAGISRSIIAGNGGFDCQGQVGAAYSLVQNPTGCQVDASDLSGVDPMLGPLADNGGPTLTRALLPGSPAIDTGGDCALTTDQRGVPRPRGPACDIGAYEYSTFVVNSTADAVDASPGDAVCASEAGECTLRAAIMETNALQGPNTIVLPAGRYELALLGPAEDAAATGDLDIGCSACTKPDLLIVEGAGASSTIIDGLSQDRVFDVLSYEALLSGPLRSVILKGLTIEGGSASGGAALAANQVYSIPSITIVDSVVTANAGGPAIYTPLTPLSLIRSAVIANQGDGVLTRSGAGFLGDLTIIDSTISGNTGSGISFGGAFATLTVLRTTISHNGSRGLSVGPYDTVTIEDSSINDNAQGLFVSSASNVKLLRSLVRGNSPNGGIKTFENQEKGGPLTLIDSEVSGNVSSLDGGGINNDASNLFLFNSAVVDNESGGDGGGVYSKGIQIGLINSTISQNRAAGDGGGLFLGRGVHQTHFVLGNVTIAHNAADADGLNGGRGGGVMFQDGNDQGAARFANSLIAQNSDDGTAPDCYAGAVAMESDGYNLIGDPQGCAVTGNTTGNLTGIDPLLGALADNGGPTDTHALLASSPAIDAGDPNGCLDYQGAALLTDQRGAPRPQQGRCDIGAYEFACGDGAIDLGETCDDGNTLDGDCCSANCQIEPAGTTCTEDGKACTADECDGNGVCAHPPGNAGVVCRPEAAGCDVAETCTGDDTECPADINPPCPAPTDTPPPIPTPTATLIVTPTVTAVVTQTITPIPTDTPLPSSTATPSPTSTDTTAPTPSPTPPLCAPTPQAGCKTPSVARKSTLTIKDRKRDQNDSLDWHWLKGAATTKSEFGAPDVATDYALCIYDAGPPQHLVLDVHVPAGQLCGARRPKPCWKTTKNGFQYHDADGAADGVRSILLQEGLDAGKAKIVLSAKGDTLAMPSLLSLVPPLTVQLTNSDGHCWEATFSQPSDFEASKFHGKADPTPAPRPTRTPRP